MSCVLRMSGMLYELCVRSEQNILLPISMPEWQLEVLSLSILPCQGHLSCVCDEFLGGQL